MKGNYIKMQNGSTNVTCPNCGAPITTEICPFCGHVTGVKTKDANMDYPLLDCKGATLNSWTILFPMIFVASFGFFGIVMPIYTTLTNKGKFEIMQILFLFPFTMVAIGGLSVIVKNISRYITLKLKGKRTVATVYGYVDDDVTYNGVPGQVVKLLVNTSEGKRFILYKMNNTTRPYGINSKINLIVYKNIFMIEKNKRENIKW